MAASMARTQVQPREVVVPEDDPYKYDLLDRRDSVEVLARLIGSIDGPCVLGIDAPWGDGKTTYLRMLDRHFRKDGIPVVSFNAWESDFSTDPFVAIFAELTEALKNAQESESNTPGAVKQALQKATEIFRNRKLAVVRSLLTAIPEIGPALAALLDGFSADDVDGPLMTYHQAKGSVNDFKTALSEAARATSESRDHPFLVLMIDELDRCRPSYAIELLEVAKHLFSVPGVVFVLAVNRAELAHSIQAVYGQEFDAQGYLGRFFDVDFRLPEPNRSSFLKSTIQSVGIRQYLQRTREQARSREFSTLESLLDTFFAKSAVSLRTAARAIHHLGLVYAAMADNRLILGTTTAVLMILRTLDRGLYHRFVNGRAADSDVADSVIASLGTSFRSERRRDAIAFEAWVIRSQLERDQFDALINGNAVDTPLMERYRSAVTQSESDPGQSHQPAVSHAREVLELVSSIGQGRGRYEGIKFDAVVKRIELLSPDFDGQDSSA